MKTKKTSNDALLNLLNEINDRLIRIELFVSPLPENHLPKHYNSEVHYR